MRIRSSAIVLLIMMFTLACKSNLKHGKVPEQPSTNSLFKVEYVSSQNKYYGVMDSEESFEQAWKLTISGPSNYKAKASLIIEEYQIPLNDLKSTASVVLGSDTENYLLKGTVYYPLSKKYNAYASNSGYPLLILEIDGVEEKFELTEVEVFEDVYFPTNQH